MRRLNSVYMAWTNRITQITSQHRHPLEYHRKVLFSAPLLAFIITFRVFPVLLEFIYEQLADETKSSYFLTVVEIKNILSWCK